MRLGLALLSMMTGPAFAAGLATAKMDHQQHHSCSEGGGFLPENDLYLEDRLNNDAGITEAQFKAVIAKAVAYYGPIIKDHSARLIMNSLWTDSTVNASASQMGSSWTVNMYGGLARRAEVTVDGFALVLCHEIGHHLGGYAFTSAWAANEGQSDYFATQSCARELWKNELEENARARATVPTQGKTLCDLTWESEPDQDLCYRIMKGSESISRLLGALGGSGINWDTKDTSVVSRTNNAHPRAQCRFDTYRAGAVCNKTFDPTLIPGKERGSSRNGADAERDSNAYACATADDFTVGTRPLCWFKPQVR